MNKEIFFKAKRKDNGEWIYGSLIYKKCLRDNGMIENHYNSWIEEYTYIYEDNAENNIEEYPTKFIEVIPETICQYTGKDDKNDVKIFENDEVYYYHKTFFKRNGKEVFDYKKEKCYVLWEKDFCGYILNKFPNKITEKSYIDPLMKITGEETIERIKNIFDKEVK